MSPPPPPPPPPRVPLRVPSHTERVPLRVPVAFHSTHVASTGVKELTHLDDRGRAHMVDVTGKTSSSREARASGTITLSKDAFRLITEGGRSSTKGDVLGVARVAGIMAAKHTPSLIPLCHSLSLSHASLEFELEEERCMVVATSCVRCVGVTGVEMEAMVALTTSLLTIYDMTKSAGKDHVISDIQLDAKSGGKSGDYVRDHVTK